MLYENIVSDSAYTSKEIFFVTSPNQDKEIVSVFYSTAHEMFSVLSFPKIVAGVTVEFTDYRISICKQRRQHTKLKGTMEVCKNKSLVREGVCL